MATWEEILAADYNPVTSMREQHQQKMEQRKAENLARMQAANPGFLPGGLGFLPGGLANPANNQYQQFAPPSVMANQSSWLGSQREVAEQLWGSPTNPTNPAAPSPTSGGSYTPQGAFQASNGPGGAPQGQGLSQDGLVAGQQVADSFTDPVNPGIFGYDPVIKGITDIMNGLISTGNQDSLDEANENARTMMGELPESKAQYAGVGLPSGFDRGANNPNEGKTGPSTTGPSNRGSMGAGRGEGTSTGGESSQGPGPGKGGGSSSGNTSGGNGSGGNGGGNGGGNANGGGSAAGGPDGGR